MALSLLASVLLGRRGLGRPRDPERPTDGECEEKEDGEQRPAASHAPIIYPFASADQVIEQIVTVLPGSGNPGCS